MLDAQKMTQDLKEFTDSMLFFSKMSHELKTPIHGIIGLSEYLSNNWRYLDDYRKRSCINDISLTAFEITDLITKLFQLATVSGGNEKINCDFKKINIVNLVKKVIKQNNRFLHDENVKLIVESPAREVFVNADPFWIQQVLSNLIGNSIKHSGARNVKVRISFSESESDESLVVSVVDDGSGIAQNDLRYLFTPFRNGSDLDKIVRSSGLGLLICKEIIDAHNGKIWVKNNNPQGVDVSFSLPKMEVSL